MKKLLFVLLLLPAPVAAQIANPVGIEFTPSVDHNATSGTVEPVNVVDGYRMRVYPEAQCPTPTPAPPAAPCTGNVAFTLQFNKPVPVANKITILNIFGGLVLNARYKGFVESYGPGGAGASLVVGPFGNQPAPTSPAAPANPVLLRSLPSARVTTRPPATRPER